MKLAAILLSFLFTALAALAADSGVVCTPDGVCYLPWQSPTAAPPAVSADDFILLRKAAGVMNPEEFLAFLQTVPASDGTVSMGFMGLILLALAGGFLLNLTPCVLPLIPVNLAIIGAGGGRDGFRRGIFYGAGMAAAYGILGVLAAFA